MCVCADLFLEFSRCRRIVRGQNFFELEVTAQKRDGRTRIEQGYGRQGFVMSCAAQPCAPFFAGLLPLHQVRRIVSFFLFVYFSLPSYQPPGLGGWV